MAIPQYFSQLLQQLPQHHEVIGNMQRLHEKKLWHQLTECVKEFIEIDGLASSTDIVQFYDTVVQDFAPRMNQLSLCLIVLTISRRIQDSESKLTFLKRLVTAKHILDDSEAHIVALSMVIELLVHAGHFEEASSNLEECEKELADLHTADSTVYASFYKAKASLLKAKNDFQNFYSNGIQYLAYAQFEGFDPEERTALAYDLAISALVGAKIYNFGELLENQILAALRGTCHEWLATVIEIFNRGDIVAWFKLQDQCADVLNSSLGSNTAILSQKISTLSVIELLFDKQSSERNISFIDIARASRINEDQVELLLMKALSLGLIKGRINQTKKIINVTWVQPRVLTESQVITMRDRLGEWSNTIKDTLSLMENQMTPELIS